LRRWVLLVGNICRESKAAKKYVNILRSFQNSLKENDVCVRQIDGVSHWGTCSLLASSSIANTRQHYEKELNVFPYGLTPDLLWHLRDKTHRSCAPHLRLRDVLSDIKHQS